MNAHRSCAPKSAEYAIGGGGYRKWMALVVLIAALMIFVPFAASTSSAEPSSADDGVSEAATEYAAYNVTKDTYYEYPYAALTEAADGDTVRLLRDVTGLQTISVTGGKAITIDLNGHSISFAFQKYFYVENGSLTLTGEGTVSEQNNFYWYAPVMIQGSTDPNAEVGYSEVVIESSVVLKGWAGIFIDNSDAVSGCAYGVKVDFDGTIISGRDTANDAGHGIYVNGSINKVAENAPVIEVSGDITSEGDGIYAAGYSHWSITDGTIKAPLGMEIRAGTLEISGGSIESTGEFVDPGPNGNGTSAGSGVALSIAQHTTKKPIEVSITGGTLIGPYAVYQANPQDNDAEALAEIKISVTGGTFVSDGEESKGVAGIYSENFTGFVQGGQFASIPYEYLSDEVDVAVDAEGNAYVGASVPEEGVMRALTGDKVVTDTWDLNGETIYTGPYRVVINGGKVVNGTLYTDVVTTGVSVVVVLNGEISGVTVEGGYRAVAVENYVGGVPHGTVAIDISAELGEVNDAVYINNVSGVNVSLKLDVISGDFAEGAVAVTDYASTGHVTISSLTGYDDIGLYIYAMGYLALGTYGDGGTAGTIVMPSGTAVEVAPLSGSGDAPEVDLISDDLVVLDPAGIIGDGESSSGVVTIDSQERFEKVLSRLNDYASGTVFEFATGEYDVTADRPDGSYTPGTYGSAFVITKGGLTFRAAEDADVTIYGFSNFFNSDVLAGINGLSTIYVGAKDTTLQGLTILPLGGYGSEAVFETQTVLVAAGADGFRMIGCATAPNDKVREGGTGTSNMADSSGLIHVSTDDAVFEDNTFGASTTVCAGWVGSTAAEGYHEVTIDDSNEWSGEIKTDGLVTVTDEGETTVRISTGEALADAISGAQSGAVIVLDADIEVNQQNISKELTIDLNDYKMEVVSGTGSYGLGILGKLTLRNGTIEDMRVPAGTQPENPHIFIVQGETASLTTYDLEVIQHSTDDSDGYYAYVATVRDGAEATLGAGTNVRSPTTAEETTWGAVGFILVGLGDGSDKETVVTVEEDAFISMYGFAISGNGSAPDGATTGSAFGNTIVNIDGGTVKSSAAQAIYNPQNGVVNVTGGLVEGITGIEMRSGEVNVTGGTVRGTGVPAGAEDNSGGSTSTGAGIAIAQHSTKNPIQVSITGGTVEGYAALYEANPQGNASEDLDRIDIAVEGGEFNAINGGTSPIYSEDFEGFVTDGEFSGAFDTSYLVPGKKLVLENGIYGTADIFASGTGADGDPFIIETVDQLKDFRDSVNGGCSYEGLYIAMAEGSTYDISDEVWVPIGSGPRDTSVDDDTIVFAGSFAGNGAVITGLNSSGYVPAAGSYDKDNGEFVYGFFGFLYNATVTDLVFEDVSISGIDKIDVPADSGITEYTQFTGDSAAALAGFATGKVSISGITVAGEVSAYDAAGGVLARYYGDDLTISGCVNEAGITATADNGGKAGGIIGIVSDENVTDVEKAVITGCESTGDISGGQYTGGILGFAGNSAIEISHCRVSGATISGAERSGGIVGQTTEVYIRGCTVTRVAITADETAGGIIGGNGGTSCINVVGFGSDFSSVTSPEDADGCTVEGCTITAGTTAGGIIGSSLGHTIVVAGGSVSATISAMDADQNNQVGGVIGSLGGDDREVRVEIHNVDISGITLEVANYSWTYNDNTYGGDVRGAAVGLAMFNGVLILSEMQETGTYELIAEIRAPETPGIDVVFAGTTATTPMAWGLVGGSTIKVELQDSQIDGLQVYGNMQAHAVDLAMDGSSSLGSLVAGPVDVYEEYCEALSPTYLYGYFMVPSDTKIVVETMYEMPQTMHSDGTHFAKGAILGTDATSIIEVTVGNDQHPKGIYSWNGSGWGMIVATVDGVGYGSLQGAIDAAESGDTVVLVNNVIQDTQLNIASDDVVTLDLNGFTISGTSDKDDGNGTANNYQMIANSGDLTIKDSVGGGQIVFEYTGAASNWGWYSNTVTNTGKLTLVSGSIINATKIEGNHIYFAVDNNSTSSDASFVMNGGYVGSGYRSIRQFVNSDMYDNTVTINGGEVYGQVWMQNPWQSAGNDVKGGKGSLTITGGEVRGNANNGGRAIYVESDFAYAAPLSITGGTIDGSLTVDPSITRFITGGVFTALGNPEYVDEGLYLAESNGVSTVEDTLADAIAAAGDTVALTGDAIFDETVGLDGKTLELNGHTLTISEGALSNGTVQYGKVIITAGALDVTIDEVDVTVSADGAVSVGGLGSGADVEIGEGIDFAVTSSAAGASVSVMDGITGLITDAGAIATVAEGSTYTVDYDAGLVFGDLPDGTSVVFAAGTYDLNLNLTRSVRIAAVAEGDAYAEVVMTGEITLSGADKAYVFEGLRFTSPGLENNEVGGTIFSSAHIRGVTITNCVAEDVYGSSSFMFIGANGGSAEVVIISGSTIEDVYGSNAADVSGVHLWNVDSVVIQNSTFARTAGTAAMHSNAAVNLIGNDVLVITGNDFGDMLFKMDGFSGTFDDGESVFEGNTFASNPGRSAAVLEFTTERTAEEVEYIVNNNTIPDGDVPYAFLTGGSDVYIDRDGARYYFADLQSAVDAAVAGDTIVIREDVGGTAIIDLPVTITALDGVTVSTVMNIAAHAYGDIVFENLDLDYSGLSGVNHAVYVSSQTANVSFPGTSITGEFGEAAVIVEVSGMTGSVDLTGMAGDADAKVYACFGATAVIGEDVVLPAGASLTVANYGTGVGTVAIGDADLSVLDAAGVKVVVSGAASIDEIALDNALLTINGGTLSGSTVAIASYAAMDGSIAPINLVDGTISGYTVSASSAINTMMVTSVDPGTERFVTGVTFNGENVTNCGVYVNPGVHAAITDCGFVGFDASNADGSYAVAANLDINGDSQVSFEGNTFTNCHTDRRNVYVYALGGDVALGEDLVFAGNNTEVLYWTDGAHSYSVPEGVEYVIDGKAVFYDSEFLIEGTLTVNGAIDVRSAAKLVVDGGSIAGTGSVFRANDDAVAVIELRNGSVSGITVSGGSRAVVVDTTAYGDIAIDGIIADYDGRTGINDAVYIDALNVDVTIGMTAKGTFTQGAVTMQDYGQNAVVIVERLDSESDYDLWIYQDPESPVVFGEDVTVPEGVNVMLVDTGTSMSNPVAIGFVLPDGSTVTKAYENGVISSFPSQESVVWFDANGSRGVVGETYPAGMVFYGRQVYDVTVSWTLDGTDYQLSYEAVAGDVIALPAIVKPGYEFAGWEIAGQEGILYVGSYTVTDAHADGLAIAMTPVFVKTEDPIVEPTVQVSISGKTYAMAAGDVVNLPVLEKTGFEFLGWQILDDGTERPGYYTGQYVITEADVEAGVLVGFEACYQQTQVPVPGATIQVTVGGTVLGEFGAGDTVSLPVLPDDEDGAPFIGWKLDGKVYAVSYTVTADDVAAGPLTFAAVYGDAPEPTPEPEPEVTVEVIIAGESRGEFAEGDVVVLHILPDRADGAPFIGWELDGKVYSGQYVIAAADLAGASLTFVAAYGDAPEPTPEPEPGVTIQVTVGGTVLGEFGAGDTVSLPVLQDRDDGAPFIGWKLGESVYAVSYTVTAEDVAAGSLAFEAAYGAVPEPAPTPEPAPSGGSSGSDTIVVALMVFVIILQVVVAFALMRK